MSIKAGQFLTSGNGFVIDRIQTGGVSSLNQNEEKIYELGNYQTVATVRDIPDLSFDLESLDVSTEIEALLTNVVPTSTTSGQEFDFTNSVPLDVISPFKSAQGLFNVVRGIAVPYLTLESATYRFGNRENATQAYTLRGDAVYYIPGSPYYQQYAGNGSTTAFNFTNTALPYVESGTTQYALGVCVVTSTGIATRLFRGTDYTDTAAGVTLTTAPASGSTLKVIYGSATAATYPQSVHQDTSIKPAAVRGKDIDVYVGTNAATPVFTRWTGVQSFEVSRRVTLDNDEEFGNKHYVAQDYDTAEVTGSITLRPRDPADLWTKIQAIADVPAGQVAGALSSTPLPVELRINNPDTGVRVKTLYIPDARFTVPSVQGRVQTKQEVTFTFSGDSGAFKVYQGSRP